MRASPSLVSASVLLSASLAGAQSFGTSNTSYISIPAWEFQPRQLALSYGAQEGQAILCLREVAYGDASPHLPDGALITELIFDYCDNTDSFDVAVRLYSLDGSNVTVPPIGSIVSSGMPGCTSASLDLTSAGYTVSNRTKRLLLEAQGVGTMFPGSTCDVYALGAVIGYRLQVSPPPAVPTFNDVPISDFGFQYIEALAASGITAGCGGNAYCPDQPINRRQMAIFLAKALGLSFP